MSTSRSRRAATSSVSSDLTTRRASSTTSSRFVFFTGNNPRRVCGDWLKSRLLPPHPHTHTPLVAVMLTHPTFVSRNYDAARFTSTRRRVSSRGVNRSGRRRATFPPPTAPTHRTRGRVAAAAAAVVIPVTAGAAVTAVTAVAAAAAAAVTSRPPGTVGGRAGDVGTFRSFFKPRNSAGHHLCLCN